MRYKIITYTLFLLFALGLIGIASIVSAQARPASTYTAYVVRIIDGDTIHVRDITGEKHRIRLAMIDAPEREQPFGTEENYYDNHWDYMNRLPDYINSDTITNLVYDVGDWYFSADGKYKYYYYVMAFVNWSKAPVILSMHQTEEEAQEQIKLLAIELNSK